MTAWGRRHPYLWMIGCLVLGTAIGLTIGTLGPPAVGWKITLLVILVPAFLWCIRELRWIRRERRKWAELDRDLQAVRDAKMRRPQDL